MKIKFEKLFCNKYFEILILIFIYLFLYYDMYTCEFISMDEGYQLALNNWSFREIINFCSIDYHVPLFAFLVKLFSYFPVSTIASSRLLLSLIAIAHFFIAFFPLERLTNKKVSLVYAITFLFSPMLIYFVLQIRMYSLANLNIFCVFIYALLVLKYNKKSDWIKLFICSVLSCYSFLITMCISFIILGLCALYCLKNKNYAFFRKYIICLIFVFLSFSPWLPNLFRQIFSMQTGRYWKYFPNSFIELIKSFFCCFTLSPVGKIYINKSIYYLFVILILFIIIFVIFNKIKHNKSEQSFLLGFCIFIVIFSFIFILGYCYINKTFAIRYFSVIYSLFLFITIYYLINYYNFFCKVIFCLFLIIFYLNYSFVIYSGILTWNNEDFRLAADIKKISQNEDIYIYHPFEGTLEIMSTTILKDYNNLIVYNNSCANVVNVLNDYSLFGNNVYVLDEFYDIINYSDSFYMIEMISKESDKFDNCLLDTLQEYNYSYLFIDEYYSGYNTNYYRLYRVRLNSVEW